MKPMKELIATLLAGLIYVWIGRYVWQIFMGPHLKEYSFNWPWWAMPLFVTLFFGLFAAIALALYLVGRHSEGDHS